MTSCRSSAKGRVSVKAHVEVKGCKEALEKQVVIKSECRWDAPWYYVSKC
jgi:hypothetical protein